MICDDSQHMNPLRQTFVLTIWKGR